MPLNKETKPNLLHIFLEYSLVAPLLNSCKDSESSWKMSVCILMSTRYHLPVGSSTLQLSFVFMMKFTTYLEVLNIFRHSIGDPIKS